MLSDLVIIRNVDSHWNTAGSKGKYIQTSEIRFVKHYHLELLTPWQIFQSLLCPIYQFIKQKWFLLIYYSHKALKFRSNFQRIQITFNKSYICFNDWTFILDPISLGLEMLLHLTCTEMLDVLINHFALDFIGWVFFSFRKIVIYLFQKGCKLSVLNFDMKSILVQYFLLGFNSRHFNSEFIVSLFSKSVIFRFNSLLYEKYLNFFSIFSRNIFWIVSACTILIWKINESIRRVGKEYQLINSFKDVLKLFSMCWPVGSWQEEFSESFLRTLRNEFGVSKRFIVSCIIQKSSNIDQNLIQRQFIKISFDLINCLLSSFLKSSQEDVEQSWWFIRSLSEAYFCSIPRGFSEIIGV